MINKNEVARGVRVKYNKTFKPRSQADKNMLEEKVVFISSEHLLNTTDGYQVQVRGGSMTQSGFAYLSELDLEFPIPTKPIPITPSVDVQVASEEIYIMHNGEEIVYWDAEEWKEDPETIVPAIATAIKLAFENMELLKKTVQKPMKK